MNKPTPKIGISLRVVNAENYDESRDALSQDWPKLLEELGFFPIYIPNTLKNLKKFFEESELNGLILSGGDNIGSNKDRDKTETLLLEFALEKKIPIIGICRGMQLINNYFGGKLDIDSTTTHITPKHEIKITDNKFLSIFPSSTTYVNSYHKNIIQQSNIGKELHPFAISQNDKTVEGFYHTKYPVIGVMWHPERNTDNTNKTVLSTFLKKDFWNN